VTAITTQTYVVVTCYLGENKPPDVEEFVGTYRGLLEYVDPYSEGQTLLSDEDLLERINDACEWCVQVWDTDKHELVISRN